MTTPPSYEILLESLSKTEQENALYKEENAILKQQIDWFKKQLFGQKSERLVPVNPDQLVLFPEMKAVEEESPKNVTAHSRRKPHVGDKICVPQDIPVEKHFVDLSEEEKICKITGEPLVKIGEEVTRKLAHKPGHFFIKEIIRPKYASSQKESSPVIAELPSTLLHRCHADESLLASIMVWKYADHIPLYRQEELLAREGIIIPRQTLSNWVIRAGTALAPLYLKMQQAILTNGNVFIDESPVDFQTKGKGATTQGYMWILCGDEIAPYRTYHFFTNRKHENAELLLKNYHGQLHSDKYGAYVKLAERKQIIWMPCFAHIRRAFFEAESGDLNFRNWVLRKIRYLFMLERIGWSRSPEERLKIRQNKEIPILDELINRIKAKSMEGKLLPKSKLSEAIGYFVSLIPYLKNYTRFANARLDNNIAERGLRPLAIGRKNWLFVGSEEGGEASAIIFSLVQTCRNLAINPRDYLEDVMRRLLDHPANRLAELLPDNWAKSRTI